MFEHPPFFIAVLLIGLRNNSRVKQKISNLHYSTEELLLAKIADDIAFIAWSKTKDSLTGENKPESIYLDLIGKNISKKDRSAAFRTSTDFEKAWKDIIER